MSDQPRQPESTEASAADPAGGQGGASPDVSPEELELLQRAAAESDRASDSAGAPDDEGTEADEAASGSAEASVRGASVGRANRSASPAGSSQASEPAFPEFDDAAAKVDPKRVTMLNDVKLRVKIELGRSRMLVEDVLKLGEGSVVELDKLAGDPVDVYVNDRLVARGEVLVLNDNFCVRVSDVISNDPHRVSA